MTGALARRTGPTLGEARFSSELRKVLHRRGLWTLKTSERSRRGVPDIYASGGIWIESKVVASMPTVKNYPLKYFSPLQRYVLDVLTKKGDNTFANICWYGDHNKSMLLMPWHEFRRVKVWDVHTLAHFSLPYLGPSSIDLDFFGWDGPRFNRARWEKERFGTWRHKNTVHVYNRDEALDEAETLEGLVEDGGTEDQEHL